MLNNKEETLWALFLEGDISSFSSLYKYYYPLLHSYGLKINNNKQATEDCLHTFFIYLYDKREKIGTIKSIKSYLFVSFRRALLLHLKKERNYSDFNKNSISDFTISPEELAIKQEFTSAKKETVAYILDTLSSREREVIYLKYYSNLNTSDISTVMDISYQSVQNTLQKAFAKLRKTIENSILSKVLEN